MYKKNVQGDAKVDTVPVPAQFAPENSKRIFGGLKWCWNRETEESWIQSGYYTGHPTLDKDSDLVPQTQILYAMTMMLLAMTTKATNTQYSKSTKINIRLRDTVGKS